MERRNEERKYNMGRGESGKWNRDGRVGLVLGRKKDETQERKKEEGRDQNKKI